MNHAYQGKFKIVFGMILSIILLTGCKPSNYFLVNSEMVGRYNRTTGEVELIWSTSLKRLVAVPDSIPFHPVPIQQDTVNVHID